MVRAFVKSIKQFWHCAQALKLDEQFSNPHSLRASEDFVHHALSTKSSYEEVYLVGLKNRDYNIVLKDYSYFQFGMSEASGRRYAYYPNPFLGASREAMAELEEQIEYVEEELISVEDYLHHISEQRYSQHPPLMRYEFAPEQYRELNHPASHMHIGHHSENRWPIARVITPVAFGTLLLKLFYPRNWKTAAYVEINGERIELDNFMNTVKKDCRVLPQDLFSDAERQHFFFT